MTSKLVSLSLSLFVCAAAHAATTNTTLSVTNGTGAFGLSGITLTADASLTNIGKGTFNGTLGLTPTPTGDLTATFTITLTSGDTIKGTLAIPGSVLAGGALTGSATITGGTGAYNGATGSFPKLTGAGTIFPNVSLSFSGDGTITTGGGGPTGPPPPTITAIVDAAANTPNVVAGGMFVVKGSNLCPSGTTTFDVPRPTVSSDGVKITFTGAGGGPGTDAYLMSETNADGKTQLQAILPSTVAPGKYNVTVTNGSASAPFAATVVASKFSLFTQDKSGTGLATVYNKVSDSQSDLNSFTTGTGKGTTISPALPGQTLTAIGTGMGPLSDGDNSSTNYDFTANGATVQAVVGGVSIPVTFAGLNGVAGQDQVSFTLPSDIPTGCTVSFQVSVNGALSNSTFIAIAPDANSTACVQPGFTTDQLQQFDQGASTTAGLFSMIQVSQTVPQVGTVKSALANGAFTRFTGYQLAGLTQNQVQISNSGSCYVVHSVTNSSQPINAAAPGGLDAGKVTLSGPSGSNLNNVALTQNADTKSYFLSLGTEGFTIPGGVNATLVAGTYTLNGAGGADVGPFNASVTLGSPLAITGGLPTNISRADGLTLNWTGGNSTDLVEIVGSAGTITGGTSNQTIDQWSFICTTTAGAQTFTVPPSILNQLPAVSADSVANGTGSGFLEVISGVTADFTAPLVAGGNVDRSTFLSLTGFSGTATYQ